MIKKIIEQYEISGNLINIKNNNVGNINTTYVATFENPDKSKKKYLIQKINTNVFTEPYKLMKNIEGVTNYLKNEMKKSKDDKHKVLELVKTKDNKSLCFVDCSGERNYFRIYHFIENAITYDCSINKNIVFNTGLAFGNFQKLLRNYPIDKLEETIKDFHHTKKRFKQLLKDIKIDSNGRVLEVAKEIVFLLMREDAYSEIIDRLEDGTIPYRVTHNDTKVNNVMMDKNTDDFVAVIDLDTVMPGSLLFDYGDGIRSTASSSSEDETDLSKVTLDLDLFKYYTDGYLSEMSDYIKEEELLLMAESIRIITLELAIRFLNDYINGDTYFKINYDKHNLDRARNQIALVKDIESKLDYMNEYIMQTYKKYQCQDCKKLIKS